MLLTVTFNPAIDLDFVIDKLRSGERYRTNVSRRSPGGTGINVSIILARLGHASIATGFLAGFEGAYILEELSKEGVFTNFIRTLGETRIKVGIGETERKQETRLHELGVRISPNDEAAFIRNYERIMSRIDCVAAGGSLPPGIDVSIYPEITRIARNNSVPIALHPRIQDWDFLLEEPPTFLQLDQTLFRNADAEETINAFMARAEKMHGMGTEWLFMSLSRTKTVFSSTKGAWIAEVPEMERLHLDVTEDALLAGTLAAIREGSTAEEVVRLAMACNWESAVYPEKFPLDRPHVIDRVSQVLLDKLAPPPHIKVLS